MATRTPELLRQIPTAIEAIPESHRGPPEAGTPVADPESAFAHVQDWAFIEGFAFVKASKSSTRAYFHRIHHQNDTRNTRKLEEKDRKRLSTNVRNQGCKVTLYVSRHKRMDN